MSETPVPNSSGPIAKKMCVRMPHTLLFALEQNGLSRFDLIAAGARMACLAVAIALAAVTFVAANRKGYLATIA